MIRRDIDYPVVGDTVTYTATLPGGSTRYRCYIESAPLDSALELFDAGKQNYLAANRITPDVPGVYRIAVVFEAVESPVQRFDIDRGPLDPVTMLPIGVARGTIEITQVGAPTIVSLTVAHKVRRVVGFAPDDCTLECYATASDRVFNPFLEAIGGAISNYYDATRSPRLRRAGTSAAHIAMTSPAVCRAVRDIGGYGDDSTKYGTRHGERLPLIEWSDIADPALLDTFRIVARAVNDHITADALSVHGVADAVNAVTAPDVPLDIPTHDPNHLIQIALLNDILAMLLAHVQIGAGTVHHDADTIATAALVGLAPLPADATFEERRVRTRALFDAMDAHMSRSWLSVGGTTYAHGGHADSHLDYATHEAPQDDAEIRLTSHHMKAMHNAHIARTVVVGSGYHVLPGDYTCTYQDAPPSELYTFPGAVRQLCEVFDRHISNRNPVTGAEVGYHAAPDTGSRTDTFAGGTTLPAAINALEALRWSVGRHASRGAPVHAVSHPGALQVRARGVEAIHHAYRSALVDATGAAPTNEVLAAAKMIMIGGFHDA